MKLRPLFEKRTVLLEPETKEEKERNSRQEEEQEQQLKENSEGERIIISGGPPRKYAIATDLHIGFEERFRGSGVRIEANPEGMASELREIIEQNGVTDLVIAGDVKSGTDRILQSEWENVPRFLSKLSRIARITIVPGNHDGGLSNLVPDSVEIADMNGLLIFDTLVMHGHTRPLIKFRRARRIVMGHVHPIFQRRGSPLSGQPVWVFLKVKRKSIFRELIEEEEKEEEKSRNYEDQEDGDSSPVEVVLVPSFNLELASTGYVYEEARAERRLAPIVKVLKYAEQAVVITLSGEVVGDESTLRNMIL